MAEPVTLELSSDEALVLFDLLARINKEGLPGLAPAEQRALWALECVLETKLTEPFLPNYAELLAAASARLTDESD